MVRKTQAQPVNLFGSILPDDPAPLPMPGQTKKERVRICIDSAGSGGHTCEEIVRKTKMRHQTVSARIGDLLKSGEIYHLIIDKEVVCGKTSSGRNAWVWITKRHKAK